ncbi:hypothetical protein HAHE_39100 [Haloferula helveola]|uniref:MetA-pathway of phenol degradation n=1 Tax=Haloferula helveola TaxID=490095 RepID=A0ABM7RRD8_9BACT|nr:hypothetical protein HAHE_39100 [Haloferula helveola]
MRRLLPLLLLPATAVAQDDDELTYGIEVLTGFRSEFIDRGFSLSQGLVEVQLGAEVALSDEWLLEIGGWYGTGTGSGDFEAASAFFGIVYEAESWDAGMDLSLSSYDHRIFDDGVAVGPFYNWYPNDDWRIGGAFQYDSGASGWYGKVEAAWSKPTGDDSFITLLGGISGTSGFYGRSGANDLFARLSWTYGVNRHVAFTPFVGTSVALDSDASTRLYAGLWFEVNF